MALAFAGRRVSDLGVDYSVDVDPRSGAAALRIPLPAPPGRADLAPHLTLDYSSGAGNSAVGAGWSLVGLPAITLDTRYHVPRWDGSDGYQLSGDELVPWLVETNGQWTPRGFTSGNWSVTFWRSRRSSGKVRVEKWVDTTSGRIHFRTRDPANGVTVFGARPGSTARIADPDDESRTLAWLPEVQLDPHGNALWFEYAPETIDGIDRSAPWERHRVSLAQRYLKRIRYGNRSPLALDDALAAGTLPAGTRWCFQLVFDYGDHASADAPGADPDRAWPARLDPFSSCRNGFEVRTYRLCRRVFAFHEFDELGTAPQLVRSLVLTHAEDPAGSTLTEVAQIGYRSDGGVVTQKQTPALKLGYAPAATETSFLEPPATAAENVPAGLAAQRYSFVDLLGDGVPGILTESDRTWFYKPNRGGGEFGAQTMVLERPATRSGAFGFGDIDSDGNTDLSQLSGRLAGLFELDRDENVWRGFRPFAQFPHVEAMGARAQWVDLNGDGRADLVVAKEQSFVWFASDGDEFEPPVELPRPDGADAAPTLTADFALDLYFADMTGDGLADLVRVRNGCVQYWPSLGNGRFGPALVMDGAPHFDDDDEFDGSRLRFVDLDGSGTSDLVYLGRGEVRCFINASGNQLVPGPRLAGLPFLDNASSARVLDFLADGRACLVWSTPLPGRPSALEYLPLTPSDPARLLISVDNSMGRLTRLTYSSSSSHYLRDLASGRGWSSRMPSHHPVVDRRDVFDQIANTQSVQRFEYHDGVYDGEERESRGFGQVDSYDAEAADGTAPGPDAAAFAAPALTRTWFHVGNQMWNRQRLRDAYLADSQLPWLAPHTIDDAQTLTQEEVDDGLHALAGQVIRRETYAVDGNGVPGAIPVEVQQASFRLRRLQPAGRDGGPAFSAVKLEEARWIYEQQAGDPRVQHQIIVETDDYDLPRRQVQIGYPRRSTIAPDVAAQGRHFLEAGDQILVHFDLQDRYELGIPVEGRSYELAGLRPTATGLFTREQLQAAAVVAALAAPGPHYLDLDDDPDNGPQARRLTWEQSLYWDDARAAALPLGQVAALTLVHHEEAACFAPAFVADALQNKIDDASLVAGGYAQHDGLWWIVDEEHGFGPATQFSQRVSMRRGDGASAQFTYDAYGLQIVATVDPLSNPTTAEIDYQQLAPWRLTDANGNQSEARYDALGVIVAASCQGHIGANPWGFDPLEAVVAREPAQLADALANPSFYLQGATRFVWYDLDAWTRDGTPVTSLVLTREAMVHDGAGGSSPASEIQVGIAYLDGLGRMLQQKTLTEPGPAIQRGADGHVIVDGAGLPTLAPAEPRWRVSGHVVYDAKQRPGRRFTPFFSPTSGYEDDVVLQEFGVSSLARYDAVGRPVGQDYPNGTFTSVTYRAWSIERSDANDNVVGSVWAAARIGRPADDPERQAYDEASPHAGTTKTAFFDPLGREVGELVRGGATAGDRRIESQLDVEGQARAIIDPRGLTAITARFDMQGRSLVKHSIDSGDRWSFCDAYDREILTWDSRGFVVTRGFDVEDRPLFVEVTGGDGATALDNRIEEWVYGESLANRADAQSRNLLGRSITMRDEAAETTVDRYDPVGRPVAATRRLRAQVDVEPDWRVATPLEPDSFSVQSRFDGMGRVVADTLVDGTTRGYEYLQSGNLDRVRVTTPDGSVNNVAILDGASFGARGERLGANFGNGVQLAWGYDDLSLRMNSQTALAGSRKLQDLAYTYDPVGNLTRIADAAQEGAQALIGGVTVSARRDYVYDAHYRLLQATGRVHQALLQNDFVPGAPGTVKGTRHLDLNNGAAVERYTRSYAYDASGNLEYLKHAGTSQSWTTNLWISTTSNRSLPALDLNGNAVGAPESKFDVGGNLRELSHLRDIEWSWRGALARAVVIARPGSTDDAERYVYASDARRVRKVTTRLISAGVIETTEKVYFGDIERKRITLGAQLILERWTIHISDGGQRIALIHRWTRDDQGREVSDPSKPHVRYQLSTHQGSSAIELDESANLISYEEYFPQGGTAFIAGDDAREIEVKEYRYSSKECDDFTSLYYYGQRYLAPWMGRWLSPDPSGPQDDLNLYQFVLGDPVGNVDRNGLDTSTPAPGEIVYVNHRPQAKADSVEGKIAAYRAVIGKEYRGGFDSLPYDQKVRLAAVGGDVWLVPKDPTSEVGNQSWTVISAIKYRSTWLPARQAWATKKKHHVTVQLFSENPNRMAGLGGAGGEHTDENADKAPPPPPTAKETQGSVKPGGGTDKTGDAEKKQPGADTGDGKGDTRGGDQDGDGSGADGKGQGDAGKADKKHRDHGSGGSGGYTGKLHGTGSFDSDVYGDGFGGGRGGRVGGETGGTPFSVGHTPGATGSLPDGPIGQQGHGSGRSGQSPSQGIAGAGAGPSRQNPNAQSGNGDSRSHAHGPPGSSGAAGPASDSNSAQGGGHKGAKQDGQGPAPKYGVKDVLLDIAGIMNFVFSEDREGGDPKGVPGGLGWLHIKGNSFTQWLYIVTSIVSFVDLIANFSKVLAGLVNLGKGILRLGWKLLSELPNLGRLGWRMILRAGEALGASGRGFLTAFKWSAGFDHSGQAIMAAFRTAKHTRISRIVLRAIEAGKIAVGFSPTLEKAGHAVSASEIFVNSSMHMEDVLATIVHEGQHALDIAAKVIPLAKDASAAQVALAELRAWWSAIRFAERNGFAATKLVPFFKQASRELMGSILEYYEHSGGKLGAAVSDEDVFTILNNFKKGP